MSSSSGCSESALVNSKIGLVVVVMVVVTDHQIQLGRVKVHQLQKGRGEAMVVRTDHQILLGHEYIADSVK